MPAVQASMGYCAHRRHTSISEASKSINQINQYCIIQISTSYKKKGITKKPLCSGASCLLDTSSPPGSLSLREMHSRIPHLASSLVDCDCKLHNTGCWIHLWRIRKAPSPRKHVLLFLNVPCIWKGKSLSPKDSIRPSANEEKFATVNSANC